MTDHRLTLHQHPFAAFCWKALIALEELDLPFGSAPVEAVPMQKHVLDTLRPEDDRDRRGVREAGDTLDTAYPVLDTRLAESEWLAGEPRE